MKIRALREAWGLTKLKLSLGFLDSEWAPQDADKDAAWDLYVELVTRILTQPLADEDGDEATALKSVYDMFAITRETLKRRGKYCNNFAKIAIPFLNQEIRPFTARWHRESLAGAFTDPVRCARFREELSKIQATLRQYCRALSMMADVEDLTGLDPATDLGGGA